MVTTIELFLTDFDLREGSNPECKDSEEHNEQNYGF